ncbi:MAG TPA: bifunctional UDP-sugar hydrolase/5'-nucleotidase [Patescibacteria group bacterium]|nr:bifunctional UDP-sugar hydrolase/5'-nucleotidase [Patescibacteria group bacterium]
MARLVWLVLACVLAGCAAPDTRTPAAAPPRAVEITLLQINDAYVLEPVDGGRRGGMARLATLVKRIRAAHPNVVFAHAGDALSPSPMSTALRGAQMIAVLNALGLDVATFGNHEFDFGPAVLRERMAESRFRWLSSNVVERGSGRPFGGAAREALLERGGVGVGLFGLTTAETASTSAAGVDVEFHDPQTEGKAVAADLRRLGADLVVGVTHQHMSADRALANGAEVDVILGGHEHEPLVAEEGKALITKAGSDARYLVEVDVWMRPGGALVERSWTFHEVSERLPEDAGVAAIVRAYATRLGRELDTEVGRTTVPLEARRAPLRTQESNLGDFLADAMRARLDADVAMINGGGIRTDRVVPTGALTKRDVLGLLPFTNVVVKLAVTGARLREALEQGLSRLEREGGGFLQVAGLRLAYDPRLPAGRRVLGVEVGGAPLDPARTYTAAVVDWIARGGDGVTALRDGRVLVDAVSGPQLADIVLEAITARGTIAPAVDGRLRDATR